LCVVLSATFPVPGVDAAPQEPPRGAGRDPTVDRPALAATRCADAWAVVEGAGAVLRLHWYDAAGFRFEENALPLPAPVRHVEAAGGAGTVAVAWEDDAGAGLLLVERGGAGPFFSERLPRGAHGISVTWSGDHWAVSWLEADRLWVTQVGPAGGVAPRRPVAERVLSGTSIAAAAFGYAIAVVLAGEEGPVLGVVQVDSAQGAAQTLSLPGSRPIAPPRILGDDAGALVTWPETQHGAPRLRTARLGAEGLRAAGNVTLAPSRRIENLAAGPGGPLAAMFDPTGQRVYLLQLRDGRVVGSFPARAAALAGSGAGTRLFVTSGASGAPSGIDVGARAPLVPATAEDDPGEVCDDGIDNDGDTLVDLCDPECRPTVESSWLDRAWSHRYPVSVAHANAEGLLEHQVRIDLDSSNFDFGLAQPDGADVRVTDGDGLALLPLFIENWDATAGTATVWVRADSLPVGDTLLYLYVGNPGATAVSDPQATFELYDGFDGDTVDPARWTEIDQDAGGDAAVAAGLLTLTAVPDGQGYVQLLSVDTFGPGHLVEGLVRHRDAAGDGRHSGQFGFGDAARDSLLRIADYNDPSFLVNNKSAGTGGADWVPTALPLDQQWHREQVEWFADRASYRIDGEIDQDETANVPAGPLSAYLFSFSSAGDTNRFDVDWVLVRKAADDQPAASLCEIEAAPPECEEFEISCNGIDDDCDGSIDEDDPDQDADGLPDCRDNCPADANPDQIDADGDGAGDACDPCPQDADDDSDDDGLCGDVDNCPDTANPDQLDADGDGLGDACDACPNDPDNDLDDDGVCGDGDNCPADANPDQLDGDGDGVGDACDVCPGDPDDDLDADGVCGDLDNCPGIANASQLDTDVDGAGDACDADDDGDGIGDAADNCPLVANFDQADSDGDGTGDACEDLGEICDNGIDDDDDGGLDLCDTECRGLPAWYDAAWSHRYPVSVGHANAADLVDHQVRIDLDATNFNFDLAQPDGDDVRLTTGDGLTPVPHFVESWDPDAHTAVVWARPAALPVGDTLLYLYVGNALAADGSDPEATFELYDGFDGSAVDPARWTEVDYGTGGDAAVGAGVLTLTAVPDGQGYVELLSVDTFGPGFLVEGFVRHRDAAGDGRHSGQFGFGDAPRDSLLRIADYNDSHFLVNSKAAGAGGANWVPTALPLDQLWHRERVAWFTDRASYEIDDAVDQDATENVPAGPLSVYLFSFSAVEATNHFDVDWVLVRKAAEQEPSDTVCAFETESGCQELEISCNGIDDDCDGSIDEEDPDQDGDAVPDCRDNCVADANADQLDTDADSIGDICDTCPADPDDDIDSDGLCGDVDNCPDTANPEQADADADGIGDVCDACPDDPDNDIDADGLCAGADNCPGVANPDQLDTDADGSGDACDSDDDGDGVDDGVDNCPLIDNVVQADADADGTGDVCDTCPQDAENDIDADGLCANVDNCPETANPEQADADADGIGDVCDACPADPDNDIDFDGLCAGADNCPGVANPDQRDADADGSGDACDLDDDGDGVEDTVDNCPLTANADQADADDDGTGDVCDTCPNDADNDLDADGLCADADNCPETANPEQADGDADGLGDVCDSCPDDADNDIDTDGVCGDVDNCPDVANPDQLDTDADGSGDACDLDDDGDGVEDTADNCPLTPNADQADADDDGTGDACETDSDGDGVSDDTDNCPDTANPDQLDTDADGSGDACDRDDDGDGFEDAVDNCPLTANADQADADGDGTGDACEADSDGDGVSDDTDNCPDTANPDQLDTDADGSGDTCDLDDDGDGVEDAADNCPLAANADQADADADGLGDVCDACPSDPDNDIDADGVCGDVDNCPDTANPDQADSDGDGTGDACETDSDGDGVADDTDNCPDTANPDQLDTDADGSGDACDLDDDGDGIEDAVDNCPLTANADQVDSDGDGLGDVCDTCPDDPDNDIDADGVCGDVDNCLETSNPDQLDSDADGLGDDCDCAPENGAVAGVPAAIDDSVTFLADAVTLTWNAAADAELYNVYKGPLAGPFSYQHTCHELGLAVNESTDAAEPASGEAFYYLVAAENCFGEGPLGSGSPGGERLGPDECADADGDGVSDAVDNCPDTPNPGQEDDGHDGIGNACG
jgi:hypothetical protein